MRNALRITAAVGGAVLVAAGGLARGGDVAAGQSMPLPRVERPAVGVSTGTVVGPYIGAIGGTMSSGGTGAPGGTAAGPAPSAAPQPHPQPPLTRGLTPMILRDPAGESRLNDDPRS